MLCNSKALVILIRSNKGLCHPDAGVFGVGGQQNGPVTVVKSTIGVVILIETLIRSLNPGFVGGRAAAGGVSEFVIPNGPLPAGSTVRTIP
jgi:hypothetical protein